MSHEIALPPFPVDPATLDLLSVAINPWIHGVEAERSSLGDLLLLMSRLGGSDTDARVSEEWWNGDLYVTMRDPGYTPNDVIAALIAEVRRLRAEESDS